MRRNHREAVMNLLANPFRTFRSRSGDRDRRTDADRIASVIDAIDKAIADAQAERAGLHRRLETATMTAATAAGTDIDEYVDRESSLTDELRGQEDQMRNAAERLRQLDQNISDLDFMRMTCSGRLGRRGDDAVS
jgi:chromosome segregation ATPase